MSMSDPASDERPEFDEQFHDYRVECMVRLPVTVNVVGRDELEAADIAREILAGDKSVSERSVEAKSATRVSNDG
jgi:hypothetical protein